MFRFVVIFSVFSTVVLAPTAFFFEDSVVCETEIEDGAILAEGVDVVTTDAEKWWIEEGETDWNSVIKSVPLVMVDSPPKGRDYRLVNVNPPVLKDISSGKFYVYMAGVESWFAFEHDLEIGKRVLRAPGVSKAILAAPGTWKARYVMRDKRFLELDVFLKSSLLDSADVYLVTGKFRTQGRPIVFRGKIGAVGATLAVVESLRAAERRVYHIGEIDGISKGVWNKVFEGILSGLEEIYEYDYAVSSGNVRDARARYIMEVLNDPKNGLGFPLPDGEIVLFESVNNREIPVGTYGVEGANVGKVWRIIGNESPYVLVNVSVISSKRFKDSVRRKFLVKFENHTEGAVEVRFRIVGRRMELLSSDITPDYEDSNVIVFSRDVDDEFSFGLEVESAW